MENGFLQSLEKSLDSATANDALNIFRPNLLAATTKIFTYELQSDIIVITIEGLTKSSARAACWILTSSMGTDMMGM